MVASNTDICNMALSHLGTAKEIGDLETETSQEANACRRFYPTALNMVLGDYDWGFATKTVELALVATLDRADGAEYNYSYRYPASAIKVRRLLSGARVDSLESSIKFRIAKDATGKLILADAGPGNYFFMSQLFAEITTNDVPPELYTSEFALAVSFMLASLIAPRLTSGDPMGLGGKALQKYYLTKSQAVKNDLDQGATDVMLDSEFIRIRN